MDAWKPSAGDIYSKPYNDGIKALVITPIDRTAGNGWFCLGLPIYRNGSFGRPMLISVHPQDCLRSRRNPLPKIAAQALRRHRAIQRKRHAEYVSDDTCERYEGGRVVYVRGGI